MVKREPDSEMKFGTRNYHSHEHRSWQWVLTEMAEVAVKALALEDYSLQVRTALHSAERHYTI